MLPGSDPATPPALALPGLMHVDCITVFRTAGSVASKACVDAVHMHHLGQVLPSSVVGTLGEMGHLPFEQRMEGDRVRWTPCGVFRPGRRLLNRETDIEAIERLDDPCESGQRRP